MRLLALIFFLLGLLLLFGGVSALGAAVVSKSVADLPDGYAWKPPLSLVDAKALAPATVFAPLTGAAAAQALNASFERAHWENALAIAAYDPALADPARVGALLQLGERFAARRQSSKAAWCYQFAVRLVTLSPALADSARVDTYLQAATGLRGVNARDAARVAVDLAFLVAQFSPALRRELRAQKLNQIADAYDGLGAGNLAAQARSQVNDAGDASANSTRLPFLLGTGALPAAAELDRAIKARTTAAQALADEAENRAEASLPTDLTAPLADALLNEDDARAAYYAQQFAQTKDAATWIALRRDQLNWLALKYRVARGAFGANLVPEWTPHALETGAQVSDGWAEWFRLYEAQANALTDSGERDRALEDVYRQELWTIRWGWFTRVAENDVRAALVEVTQRLQATPALRVDRIARGSQTLDALLPDELYGKNEKALPK